MKNIHSQLLLAQSVPSLLILAIFDVLHNHDITYKSVLSCSLTIFVYSLAANGFCSVSIKQA